MCERSRCVLKQFFWQYAFQNLVYIENTLVPLPSTWTCLVRTSIPVVVSERYTLRHGRVSLLLDDLQYFARQVLCMIAKLSVQAARKARELDKTTFPRFGEQHKLVCIVFCIRQY